MQLNRHSPQPPPIAPTPRTPYSVPTTPAHPSEAATTMEFLNFVIIMVAAWLVWRRPEREGLAFRLMLVSCVIMTALYLIGTHTSLIPRVNL